MAVTSADSASAGDGRFRERWTPVPPQPARSLYAAHDRASGELWRL